MCLKSRSILSLIQCPLWILAALALFAPQLLAWNCTTQDQFGTCNYGSWIITQDVWGAASGWQQSLYSDSHSHWQIVANLKGQKWVGSYPHASYPVNQALNDVLTSPAPLLAAWNANYPKENKFDFAYDLWLNGTTYEVMIWLDWKDTSPIGINPFTNAVIGGIPYNIYEGAGSTGPHCISFLPQNGMMPAATNFNFCNILSWISNLRWGGGAGGYYWHNPNFESVQLGWEICDTHGGSKTYTMNSFDVYLEKTAAGPPTPTVEKRIWQANFDNTFPNNGGYGFSDRDGSPSASGNVSTNLTGGVDGSASLEYTVDFSPWSNRPPASYSGFGVGATESPLPYTLTSANQASYRIYLSAKVGGVSAGVTNVPATVDVQFFVPAGSLSPANKSPAAVFDLNSSLALSTNWQSYVFDGADMQVGTYISGAQALFKRHISEVNQLEVQVAVSGSPDVGKLFGYCNSNTVDIDNIQVVALVPKVGDPKDNKNNRQTKVILADPPAARTANLQGATNAAETYLGVEGDSSAATTSPYIVPPGSPQQFFRAIWIH